MPELAGYGEDRLVAALLARLPAGVRAGPDVIAGAGDDCAVIAPAVEHGRLQLLKTDCVIEGVHYTAESPPEKVGWKALCRPLSDIAAMGGQPLCALVTLALPGTATVDYAKAVYDGLGAAAERFGVRIVGGETARSPSMGFVSVALTGEVDPGQMATRSGGQPGDLLYVTGTLGGSYASGKHFDFIPRLEEARWLVTHFPVSAMMDLSDGLGRDLRRLARTSKTGYTVVPAQLPCTAGCGIAEALDDGEDYELLFALPASSCEALESRWSEIWPGLKLSCIGCLSAEGQTGGIPPEAGYDHFAPSVASMSTAALKVSASSE